MGGIMKRDLAAVFALLIIVFMAGCPPKPNNDDTTLTIKSLDKTSAEPFSTLTIIGNGFDPQNSAISVRLIPHGTGTTIVVPVASATNNQIGIVVPPFLDSTSGLFSSGIVDVQVIKVSGSLLMTSNVMPGLSIKDLPSVSSSVKPGAITKAYLTSGLVVLDDVKNFAATDQKLVNMFPELDSLSSDLNTLLSQIDSIINNPQQTVNLTTVNGQPFLLDSNVLAILDQLIAGYLPQFVRQIQAESSTLPKTKISLSPCTPNTFTPSIDEFMCSKQVYYETVVQTGAQGVQWGATFETSFFLGVFGGWAGTGLVGAEVISSTMGQAFQLLWTATTPYISSYFTLSPTPPLSKPLEEVGAKILDMWSGIDFPVLKTALKAYNAYSKGMELTSNAESAINQGGLIISSGLPSEVIVFPSGENVNAQTVTVSDRQEQIPVPPDVTDVISLTCPTSLMISLLWVEAGTCTVTVNLSQSITMVPLNVSPPGILNIPDSVDVFLDDQNTATFTIFSAAKGTATVTAGPIQGSSATATVEVESLSVTISSASCLTTSIGYDFGLHYSHIVWTQSGTGSGPIGTTIKAGFPGTSTVHSCGAWTTNQPLDGCTRRDPGQPESTSWSATSDRGSGVTTPGTSSTFRYNAHASFGFYETFSNDVTAVCYY